MSVRRALRRAGWSVLVLLVSAVGTFALLRLVPADPARVIAGPKADAATIAAIRADLELDRPALVQLGHHLGRLVRGDLGRSYRTGRPVLREIVDRLPASGALALAAIAIGVGVGLALAVLTSRRAGGWTDSLVLGVCLLVLSTPVFWLGSMLLQGFAGRLRWFPLGGGGSLAHLALPALTLGLPTAALYARLLHVALERELRSAHVRTAIAKGVSPRAVLLRHALRSALGPLVVAIGLDLGALLGGAVLTETVFAWPGLGRLAVEAVFDLDVPLVLGTTWIGAALVVGANLGADLLASALDPRTGALGMEEPG